MAQGIRRFASTGGPWGSAGPADFSGGSCESCGLLAEADHRIANHLAMLGGYLRLRAAEIGRQDDVPSRESVRLTIETAILQIDAVSRLHRALATHGSRAAADLSAHLHDICSPFASGVFGPIALVEDFPPTCLVSADQVLPLTQIVAEVLTNAVKHAHRGGAPGGIMVRCARQDEGLVIEVIDSGPGLPPGFDPDTNGGLGFRLLRGLARQLRGEMSFRSTDLGVRFTLVLPPRD